MSRSLSRSPSKRSANRQAPTTPETTSKRTSRSKAAPLRRPSPQSDEGSVGGSDNDLDDDSDDDALAAVVSHSKEIGKERQGIFSQTSFDTYFLHASRPARTSSNVFSALLEPLSADEYEASMASASKRLESFDISPLQSFHRVNFSRYLNELHQGFNLLFYGFGSKHDTLNLFATDVCAKHGHVVVAKAFSPHFALKDLVASVEKVTGPLPSGQPHVAAQRICNFFSDPQNAPLYLVIHNIDAPALRNAKAKIFISQLGLHFRVHIIASIDHINAPLLWSSSEIYARKAPHTSNDDEDPTLSHLERRGYAWLWHDLMTLAPYDFELAFADRSSLSGASASTSSRAAQADASAPGRTMMTESAASHVLASVTEKAKRLFVMMGEKQLAQIAESGSDATADLQQFAIGYDALFNAARDAFIATSDGALRALLGEFRDHGLVVSAGTGGAGGRDALWIPMRKERLAKVLDSLKAQA